MRTRSRFQIGQRVIVNTGGDDVPGTVSLVPLHRDQRRGTFDAVLVRFDNGSEQWITERYVRAAQNGQT